MDFDPKVVSYTELLELFFAEHRPTRAPYSRQYRSVIYTHDYVQAAEANAAKAHAELKYGQKLHTAIEPAPRFWLAEAYHQKYRLRGRKPLMKVFDRRYKDLDSLLRAPEVTWTNAAVAGAMNRDRLSKKLQAYPDRGAILGQLA